MLALMQVMFAILKRTLSAGLLGFLLIPFFPWSCQRRPAPPPPPPAPAPAPAPIPEPAPASAPSPPNYFEMGESYYVTGDYTSAAQSYQSYLDASLEPANHDRALFRLALISLFPESPVQDQSRALETLQKLVADFPQSLYRPEAEFLLRLHQEVEGLRTDLSKRDQRIRELTQELERLKQIDMQRRPSRLPP